mmetsp:Transcript_51829/g.168453  ORF Transcript_51829/g.168453 Transcript_51829/m.168453 type:complete len:322 (+) Transcript_51829:50-1015(+)|eukprot:CAMPEP_0203964582 /NCGR_PEP_ID=MMETSP0359-20131031/94298_1 /ASSEMBLY_ACC=CAM_ASM_000338 /TAXON_ID=268821 /ORGANISM="Scrippsiella Hangoei, Strain SHTV-5" /LENGTH=321 /DNA_ID=CAMNT_0050901085 /DNA_START=50 /DNA_END=1015 /DNA_ORIENTATION=+
MVSHSQCSRRRSVVCAVVAAAVVAFRHGSEGFVAGQPRGSSACVQGRTALSAYGPVCRRDPQKFDAHERAVSAQLKYWRRQRKIPESDAAAAAKKKYLVSLGLGAKMQDNTGRPPWHLTSMVAGQQYFGLLAHPIVTQGNQVDLSLSVNSPTEGELDAKAGQFNDVKIMQDFPIAFEGEQRTKDQVAYIFCKYNMKWRDFDGDLPKEEEMQYLSFQGLQLWFAQAVGVPDYPPQEEFDKSCADPSKGMSKEEFMKYTLDDNPTYIEQTFKRIYTNRRVQLIEGDLILDGDFSEDAPGAIFGLAYLKGDQGKPGNFALTLRA